MMILFFSASGEGSIVALGSTGCVSNSATKSKTANKLKRLQTTVIFYIADF